MNCSLYLVYTSLIIGDFNEYKTLPYYFQKFVLYDVAKMVRKFVSLQYQQILSYD